MSLFTSSRRIGFPLTTAAAAVTVLALTASAADASALWCGAGRGRTAEGAIQSAMDDARTSASGEGLFTCELVGEPEVFESFNDPNYGHVFRAQVNMSCS